MPTRFELENEAAIESVAKRFSHLVSMDLAGWRREELVERIAAGEHPVEVLNEHLANWHDYMEEALFWAGFKRDRLTEFHNMWNYAWFRAAQKLFYLPEAGHLRVPEYEPPREFLSPTREQEEEGRLRRSAAAPGVPETRKWWYLGYGKMDDHDLEDNLALLEEAARDWRDDPNVPHHAQARAYFDRAVRAARKAVRELKKGDMRLASEIGREGWQEFESGQAITGLVPPEEETVYAGYGGNMTNADMARRAEELSWSNTRDSIWEGPTDDSDPANWALTVSRSRDSDPLAVSNYNVISKDMLRRFPDDVEEHAFSHWAVGWVEHLFVRIRDDDGEFTPAFEAIIEWEEQLSDYPVADEEDLSETEQEMGYDPEEGY